LVTQLREAIESAANGTVVPIDVTELRAIGNRNSWSASASVCGDDVLKDNSAHGRALGRTVAALGLCAPWPDRQFQFSVSKDLKLTVRIATGEPDARPDLTVETALLYEDEVVTAVVTYLRSKGWAVERTALATEHGDDIVASKGDRRLVVEAKGAGSSKPGTSRYGRAFTGNQVKTHVSVAIFRALTVTSVGTALAAVAFPDNPHHRQTAGRVTSALARAEIGVFWVDSNHDVDLDAPWSL
jgi:hypothetical protein